MNEKHKKILVYLLRILLVLFLTIITIIGFFIFFIFLPVVGWIIVIPIYSPCFGHYNSYWDFLPIIILFIFTYTFYWTLLFDKSQDYFE